MGEPPARVVKIPGAVHFAFDHAKLSPATQGGARPGGGAIGGAARREVKLDAFTDPQGQSKYNQQLSARRGEAVRRYLVEKGVNPARISVVPLGATAPIKDPSLPRLERYALDRRVDIQILPMNG